MCMEEQDKLASLRVLCETWLTILIPFAPVRSCFLCYNHKPFVSVSNHHSLRKKVNKKMCRRVWRLQSDTQYLKQMWVRYDIALYNDRQVTAFRKNRVPRFSGLKSSRSKLYIPPNYTAFNPTTALLTTKQLLVTLRCASYKFRP